jgi:LysR family transcriptional regulator, nod-box dependent transcriptional activator
MAAPMRFKGLDLNLLVALDILLTEKNVSRAADRLFLSQSATSGALARLRDYFGDELLVQVGRKMVLTPRAQALAAKVRASLMQIDGTIIQPPEFDPATVHRTIRITASDYVLIAELANAIRRIRLQAPDLTIVLLPPGDEPAELLQQGRVDLLAMPEVYLAPDHPSSRYFADDYVIVVWSGSTAHGETMTAEQFFQARHVTMQFAPHTPSYEAWFIRNRGADRKVAAVAGSFTAVPFLIEGTDNVALVQGRMALRFAQMMPLRLIPSPIEIPPLVEHLQWHGLTEGDECLAWVRREILAAKEV